MIGTRGVQGVAIVAALLAAPCARAESVADVLSTWGMMGSWKTDCSSPPSESGMRETYARRGAGAVEIRDFGAWKDTNPVLSAAVNADGSLTIVIEFTNLNNDRRVNTLVKSEAGKRTVDNYRMDGSDVTVREGVFAANGQPTPWFKRCR